MKIDSEAFEQVFIVPSDSRPDKNHVVIMQGDHWLCTCEDYTYDPDLQPLCKHIAKIISDKLDWPLDHRGHLMR